MRLLSHVLEKMRRATSKIWEQKRMEAPPNQQQENNYVGEFSCLICLVDDSIRNLVFCSQTLRGGHRECLQQWYTGSHVCPCGCRSENNIFIEPADSEYLRGVIADELMRNEQRAAAQGNRVPAAQVEKKICPLCMSNEFQTNDELCDHITQVCAERVTELKASDFERKFTRKLNKKYAIRIHQLSKLSEIISLQRTKIRKFANRISKLKVNESFMFSGYSTFENFASDYPIVIPVYDANVQNSVKTHIQVKISNNGRLSFSIIGNRFTNKSFSLTGILCFDDLAPQQFIVTFGKYVSNVELVGKNFIFERAPQPINRFKIKASVF
jgi:hypothetical protein